MILLAAIGAIGFLIVTWFAVSNLRARRAERREEREARERDWATGQAVYKGVLDDYSAYLLDPFAWLQRPILEDVDEPQTAAFLEALAHTQALDLDIVPADQNRIDQFRTAAHELRAAWDKADENAPPHRHQHLRAVQPQQAPQGRLRTPHRPRHFRHRGRAPSRHRDRQEADRRPGQSAGTGPQRVPPPSTQHVARNSLSDSTSSL
ncbi:hypothetical protein GS563_28495 [Rhodococcus hoagii]|nr:hypothetical protein [Prescottella equi]